MNQLNADTVENTQTGFDFESNGICKAFAITLWRIIFSPLGFFRSLPPNHTISRAYYFGVIASTVGNLFYSFNSAWNAEFSPFRDGLITGLSLQYILHLLLIPMRSAAGILIIGLLCHLLLWLGGAAKGGFRASLIAFSYASAAEIFLVIPQVGIYFEIVFLTMLTLFGMSVLHKISWQRTLAAFLIPLFMLTILATALLSIGLGWLIYELINFLQDPSISLL